MKLLMAANCYLIAFLTIYLGFQLAPDMIWPKTDIEYAAVNLIIIGLGAKFLGHIFLFDTIRAR